MASETTERPISVAGIYARLLKSRFRSQLQYRGSFITEMLGQILLVFTEFIEVWVLLRTAPIFAGLTLPQTTLLYGLARLGFSLADLIFGQLDNVNRKIKRGEFEILMVRPISLLGSLITSDAQLRRVGSALMSLLFLLFGVRFSKVALTPANIALTVLSSLAGLVIFGALFLIAAGLLFWILDGNQAVNTLTHGGRAVSSVPGAALHPILKIFFTFVVPATLIAYVPTCVMTGAPLDPFWWPGLAWLTLPIGLIMWAVGLGIWRLSIKHYEGAGG